jgi:hypothetical protein
MARGAQEFDSLDGWLGHKPRSGGGNFVKGWKKKPGYFNSWMHVKRLPLAIFRHSFPTPTLVKDKENNGEQVKHIFTKKFTCHETQEVLSHPWRDKTTGEREKPPERCGKCKFADFLWMNILSWLETHKWEAPADEPKMGKWVEKKKGKGEGIDPCATLFDFVSEAKDEENVKMTVGGYCGFFSQKELPADLKKAMARAKIRGDEAWKENTNPKCEYAMTVVDNDEISKGLQIAVETQALGEKVKEVITKTFKSTEQNIQKQPYCIRWDYDEKKSFSEKYDATAMLKMKPSARVLKLIRGEAPDLTELKTPFNQIAMRAIYEKACLLPEGVVDWDAIFPDEEQIEKWKSEDELMAEADEAAAKSDAEDEDEDEASDSDDDEDEEEEDEEEEDDDAEEEEKAPKSKTNAKAASKTTSKKKDAEEDDSDGDEQMVKCDECGKPMKLSASKCPHCGHEYDVTPDDDEEEKPEPKVPTRAELAAQKKKAESAKASAESAKKKTASAKTAKSKKKDEEEDEDADEDDPEDEDDNQGDDVPFD